MDDGNQPATKADIGALQADIGALKADVGALKADVGTLKADVGTLKADVGALKADMEELRDGLQERIQDAETKLLTAFYDFAKAHQQRISQLEGNDATLTRRVAGIEDRLLEVEKRLNMPPAA